MKAAAVLGLAICLAAGGACRERGRPDPKVHMAPSHDVEPAAGAGSETGTPQAPTRLEVPPEVQKAFRAIRLSWKDNTGGQEGVLEVPLGGTTKVPGSSLEVRGDVYLPAFSMAQNVITSSGVEEENPAARITVAENGSQVFEGWVFTRFPDVHPFQHPRFTLKLVGGVRRAPAKT